jgi:uncharacterized protein (DUF2141 family)
MDEAQSIIFTHLPPGRYAVINFHDENDNGRLDENPWGAPTEGYGFSKNAQGFLGAPSFDSAAVSVDGADASIAIALICPKLTTGICRSHRVSRRAGTRQLPSAGHCA